MITNEKNSASTPSNAILNFREFGENRQHAAKTIGSIFSAIQICIASDSLEIYKEELSWLLHFGGALADILQEPA